MLKLLLTPKKYIEDNIVRKKIYFISKYQNQKYSIRFEEEPENKYDPKAIKVFMTIGVKKPEEYFIGYLAKNEFWYNQSTGKVETDAIPETNNTFSLKRILLETNWKYIEESDYDRYLYF